MNEAPSSTRRAGPRLAAVVGAVVFLLLAWRLSDWERVRNSRQGYWIPPAKLPASDAALDVESTSETPAEPLADVRGASPVAPDAELTAPRERSEPATPAPPPAASFVSPAPLSAGARRSRIAVVDLQRLFDAHPMTKDHLAKMNERRTQRNPDLTSLPDREDPETAGRLHDAKEKELQDEARQVRTQILTDLQLRIAAAVSKGDFDLLFDLSGKSLGGLPVILQAPGLSDLTDDLLRELSP